MEALGFNYVTNYMRTAFPTGDPVWTTENYVSLETDQFLLRCFRICSGKPTLILPPQAGHSSTIADYDKGQSLVATALENTSGPVYCVEWKSCTQERKHESLDDLVTQVVRMVSYIGSANLVGLCQGGWLATMFAARCPDLVLSLVCVASPIDFHAGGGVIYDTITEKGMKPYEDVVMLSNGIMPGAMMLLGWKLMHPAERFLGDYMEINRLALFGETKKLKKIERFRRWYEYTQDLPGAWYLEICEKGFLNNLLTKGKMRILGKDLLLSDIYCPIAMVSGELDDITLTPQVNALMDYTTSEHTYDVVIPKCGHIGCFMGSKSQAYLADVFQWMVDVT